VKKFKIKVPFSGYVRGEKTIILEASTKEEALKELKESDYIWEAGVECNYYREDIEHAFNEVRIEEMVVSDDPAQTQT
jgi:hypothetical protein